MQVKNISSSTIDIPDLGIKNLGPGNTFDLSDYDPKELRVHKTLNLYFEKGLLANLGRVGKSSGTKASLQAAKTQIDRLKIMGNNENVVKQRKKTSLDKRKMIDDLASKKVQDKPHKQGFDPKKERYRDEFLYNMDPSPEGYEFEYDDELEYDPKPRPQTQEQFEPMKINYDGNYEYFGAKGNIETGLITGETTNLRGSEETELTITERSGKEHKISFDKVKEKMLRKCIGTTSSGKPCKKYAVHGFQSCLTHMSRSEKEEYEQLKKQQEQTRKSS